MSNDDFQRSSKRRLSTALGGVSLETPPTETGSIEHLIEENLDASQYAKHLATKWRALLEESSEIDEATRESGSFFFRPRVGIGLEPPRGLDTPSCKAGDVLEDFELLRLIGQGGMGQVWEARQRRLDRLVALKVIRPDRMTPVALEFFAREGRAAGRLRHPSIVTVHAMGETDGVHWIAQEFIDGECTLADFLDEVRSANSLPRTYDRRIALFFYQLSEALAFAHRSNVTHRDLKPQNVLITEADRPKLTDFGLARLEEEGPLRVGGGLLGTPRYMSPEQALGHGEELGQASDIFSLGAMLYQALTLAFPFEAQTLPEILQAVVEHDPIPCQEHRPSIDPDLAAIVSKAMQKDPRERYTHMRDFASDLAAYLDGRPVIARPIGIVERTRKLVRRRPRQTAVVIGVTFSVLALFALTSELGDARAEIGDVQAEAGDARADADHARWAGFLNQANTAVDRTDHDAVHVALDAAEAVLPGRPEGSLILAGMHVRAGQLRRAKEALEEAVARGYDPKIAPELRVAGDLGNLSPEGTRELARAHYLHGIYLMATGDSSSYPEARDSLRIAHELAPDDRSVYFPIYIVSYAMDNTEEAYWALDRFQRGLTVGDPHTRMIEGMKHEQLGDPQQAVEVLQALADDPEVARKDLDRLSFSRIFGRNLLLAERYEDAVVELERAVNAAADDRTAWTNLGIAYLMSASSGEKDEELILALLDKSEDAVHAGSVEEYSTGERRRTLGLHAQIEEKRNVLRGESKFESLEALEAFDATDPIAGRIRGAQHFTVAYDAWNEGRADLAVSEIEQGLRFDQESFAPHVLLGQAFGFGSGTELDYERAWTHLERARDLWMDRDRPTGQDGQIRTRSLHLFEPKMAQAMLVARFWVARGQGDQALAEETGRELEEYLVTEPFAEFSEQLTYAEALVLPDDPKQRDVERAQELYDDYLERAGIAEGEWPAHFDSTVRNLLARIEATR